VWRQTPKPPEAPKFAVPGFVFDAPVVSILGQLQQLLLQILQMDVVGVVVEEVLEKRGAAAVVVVVVVVVVVGDTFVDEEALEFEIVAANSDNPAVQRMSVLQVVVMMLQVVVIVVLWVLYMPLVSWVPLQVYKDPAGPGPKQKRKQRHFATRALWLWQVQLLL